jgi:hypothetical protein
MCEIWQTPRKRALKMYILNFKTFSGSCTGDGNEYVRLVDSLQLGATVQYSLFHFYFSVTLAFPVIWW